MSRQRSPLHGSRRLGREAQTIPGSRIGCKWRTIEQPTT